jgi:hypothetical protein
MSAGPNDFLAEKGRESSEVECAISALMTEATDPNLTDICKGSRRKGEYRSIPTQELYT